MAMPHSTVSFQHLIPACQNQAFSEPSNDHISFQDCLHPAIMPCFTRCRGAPGPQGMLCVHTAGHLHTAGHMSVNKEAFFGLLMHSKEPLLVLAHTEHCIPAQEHILLHCPSHDLTNLHTLFQQPSLKPCKLDPVKETS
eukprot:458-Pelagomonas_calceolata.AAC.2